jgi:hypothetical protein
LNPMLSYAILPATNQAALGQIKSQREDDICNKLSWTYLVLSPRNRPCSPPPPRGWRPCSWSVPSPANPRLSLPKSLRLFNNVRQWFLAEIIFSFLIKNCHVQAMGEAFSPQKRTSSTLKMKFINFLYIYGSVLPSWIRIWIANLDPDPGTH